MRQGWLQSPTDLQKQQHKNKEVVALWHAKKKKKNKKRRKKKKKKAASLQIVHMHTQLIPSFGLRPTFPKILKITPWALFSNGANSPCNIVVYSHTFFDISPSTVWRLLRALHAHGMFEFLAAASRPPATASQLRTSRHRSSTYSTPHIQRM